MNFDYLRLFLATIVMFSHYSLEPEKYWQFINSQNAVYAFFCISGFLVTQSYMRSKSLEEYFKKRFARIYPPIVAVFIAIFIFGLVYNKSFSFLLSTTHLLLFQDLTSVQDGPSIYFHGAFWTLVIEFQFYLLLPFLIFFIKRNPRIATVSLVIIYIILSIVLTESKNQVTFQQSLTTRQSLILYLPFFLSGLCLSFFWEKFNNRKRTLLAAVALLIISVPLSITSSIALAILVLALASLLGYFTGKKAPFGDLSYGIYIYHFPVREIMMNNGNYTNLSAICVVLLLSFMSWHLLEKPILKLAHKKHQALPVSHSDAKPKMDL